MSKKVKISGEPKALAEFLISLTACVAREDVQFTDLEGSCDIEPVIEPEIVDEVTSADGGDNKSTDVMDAPENNVRFTADENPFDFVVPSTEESSAPVEQPAPKRRKRRAAKAEAPEPAKAEAPEPAKAEAPEPAKAEAPEPAKAEAPEPAKAKAPEPAKAEAPKREIPKPVHEEVDGSEAPQITMQMLKDAVFYARNHYKEAHDSTTECARQHMHRICEEIGGAEPGKGIFGIKPENYAAVYDFCMNDCEFGEAPEPAKAEAPEQGTNSSEITFPLLTHAMKQRGQRYHAAHHCSVEEACEFLRRVCQEIGGAAPGEGSAGIKPENYAAVYDFFIHDREFND